MQTTNSWSEYLLHLQDIRLRTGRPVLLLEVAKPSPSSTPEDVGAMAAQVNIHTFSSLRTAFRLLQKFQTLKMFLISPVCIAEVPVRQRIKQ
jgi:hypothetical protein